MHLAEDQTPDPRFLELIEHDSNRFVALVEEEFSEHELVRSLDGRYLALKGQWVADLAWEGIVAMREWLGQAGEAEAEAFGVEDGDFNAEFWKRPQPLYHATTPANREGIERNGLLPEARTRGISNRRVGGAVFTSTDPGELGSYGPVVVEVDAARMKRDGIMPRVSRETDVETADRINRLAQLLGCEDFQAEIEAGMSEQTIIVHGHLPAAYIRMPQEPSVRPLPTPQTGPVLGGA